MSALLQYVALRREAAERRLAGGPAPWSGDSVIAKKFFCNVIRDDDRTSREARGMIQALPPEQGWAAALTFRLYNRPETLRALLDANAFSRTAPEVEELLTGLDMVFNTVAYRVMLPGGLWSIPTLSRLVVRAARMARGSWRPRERAELATQQLQGELEVGPFLAYQVMQDLRWLGVSYSDEQAWCHLGDGAVQGLEMLAGTFQPRSLQGGRWGNRQKGKWGKDLVKFEHRRDRMLELLASLREVEPRANMFELEHNLCEYRKWEGIRCGEVPGRAWRPRP